MELRVTKVSRIHSDGKHNAFTSITRFKDYVYVCFRSAATHLSFDGVVTVIRSKDMLCWETVAVLSYECDGEFRDPAIIVKDDKLFLYAGVRYENTNNRTSMVYVSNDGIIFMPENLHGGKIENLFVWDVKEYKGSVYATAYKHYVDDKKLRAWLFKSNDGIVFECLAEYPINAGEVSIDIDEDGTMYSLIRDDYNGSVPSLMKSRFPYNDFISCRALPMILHGPMIKRLRNASVIIGRNWDEPGRRNLRTDIHILQDNNVLRFVRSLPSGGDTSYASWLDYGKGSALVSYYSAHEYCMDSPVGESVDNDPAAPEHNSGADIYLAYISY